jgi:biotin transport system substrate-specific component
MILVSLFAALLAVSSQFSLLVFLVPHTLQIFFVLLAGLVLGARAGAMSVAVWVLLGVFGLPVFAQGKAGFGVLLGPTGGFLIGFILCAYLVGYLTEDRPSKLLRTLVSMFAGLFLVYAVGLSGFLVIFEFVLHKPMTVGQALLITVAPFLPFDIVKSITAAYIGVKVRRALLRAGLTVRKS